ncbi:MFS transporter [Burkholderia gladioli]|uniref:MFS transporter n=1 Tax=Burkholderia gladioli TaxID=28095 RepID=UPI0016404490|nr:MFS transporter [Burkholderia gladioli]
MNRLVNVYLALAVGMLGQAIVLLALSPALFIKYRSATLASVAFATVWLPALLTIPCSRWILSRFALRQLYVFCALSGAGVLGGAAALFDSHASLSLSLLCVRGFFGALANTAATLYIKCVAEPGAVRREISAAEASRLAGSMVSAVLGWLILDRIDFPVISLLAACTSATGACLALTWRPGVRVEGFQSPPSGGRGSNGYRLLAPSLPLLFLLLSTAPLQAYHHAARTPLAVDYLHLGVNGVAIVVLVNTVAVTVGAWFTSFAMPVLKKYDQRAYVTLDIISAALMMATPLVRDPAACLLIYGAYLFVFQVCYTAVSSLMIADAHASAASTLVPVRTGSMQAALLLCAPVLGFVAQRVGLESASAVAALASVGLAAAVVLVRPKSSSDQAVLYRRRK